MKIAWLMPRQPEMNSDYGVDAPGVVRNLFVIGAAALAISLVSLSLPGVPAKAVAIVFLITGLVLAAQALMMVIYAIRGKFQHRDRMLGMISWKGSERVLDIGTGKGLLMNGVAMKLTTGMSVGIDIWNSSGLSANTRENALRNAEFEGVKGKIEIEYMDAQTMSFQDGSFDVVLSNLCLHNIPDKQSRDKACREIARILKPGGMALISDFKHTRQYADEFQKAGLRTSLSSRFFLDTFPPLRIVKGAKGTP